MGSRPQDHHVPLEKDASTARAGPTGSQGRGSPKLLPDEVDDIWQEEGYRHDHKHCLPAYPWLLLSWLLLGWLRLGWLLWRWQGRDQLRGQERGHPLRAPGGHAAEARCGGESVLRDVQQGVQWLEQSTEGEPADREVRVEQIGALRLWELLEASGGRRLALLDETGTRLSVKQIIHTQEFHRSANPKGVAAVHGFLNPALKPKMLPFNAPVYQLLLSWHI
mmetsp:Transcript_22348/g.52194  ORF Transcript_22348/g.52194 Transcript_22348/m.52194 type:complete len:221 (-) Transcript_22348:212-874(-)